MSARKDALTDRLSRSREIIITVTGRKSGRAISIPVWFVLKAGKLYLLCGISDRTSNQCAEATLIASPITDSAQVSSVIGNFRAKYGAGDVKKYYAKFDVAVLAEMRRAPS